MFGKRRKGFLKGSVEKGLAAQQPLARRPRRSACEGRVIRGLARAEGSQGARCLRISGMVEREGRVRLRTLPVVGRRQAFRGRRGQPGAARWRCVMVLILGRKKGEAKKGS